MGTSNRQQARYEKSLHELVRSVPGNASCADCGAANPSWASWNLGIFICMRCATLHRKLGTHISKVKSLTMDKWSNDQVEHMKQTGNIVSNQKYNPNNRRPPISMDAEEEDSGLGQFIRKKYTTDELVNSRRQNTGSTESDDATPPPPPPKHGIFSAFLGASFGSKSRKSPRRTKVSQVFGASFSTDTAPAGGELEAKLAKLHDMGFIDDQRNLIVLKGMGVHLEKTIEALVRLGEGDRSPTSASTPVGSTFRKPSPAEGTSRSLASAASTSTLDGGSGGLGTSGSREANGGGFGPRSSGRGNTNTNPFDTLDKPQPPLPLSTQSTGTLPTRNPYKASTNPFGVPAAQTSTDLDQAFQYMSLGAPQQALFPHHTGGLVTSPPQHAHQQQLLTGPAGAPLNYAAVAFNSSQTYPQPAQQQAPVPQANSHNPFLTANPQVRLQQLQQQQNQQQLSVNSNMTGVNVVGGGLGNNPFARSPTRIQSPMLTQIPEQSQQSFYTAVAGQQQHPQQPLQHPQHLQQLQAQQMQAQHSESNPFFPQTMAGSPAQPPTQQQFQYQMGGQQPGQMMQGLPPRADKASIMALYNYPQLAPQKQPQQVIAPDSQAVTADIQQAQKAQGQEGPNPFSSSETFPLLSQQQQAQQYQQQQPRQQARAGSLPGGSRNPFMTQVMGQPGPAMGSGMPGMEVPAAAPAVPSLVDMAPKYNHSRDSVMAMGLDWTNGRHSPDEFASLSARDIR